MTTVVLIHGWGYDASVWDRVRARLDPALRVEPVDFGYFGTASGVRGSSADAASPAPSFKEPIIAVGHSLGAAWWLTQSTIPWRQLLSINGFPRFTTAEGYPGVAPRVLERMRRQFAAAPAVVLADFHARCGAPGPAADADAAQLADGLAQLAARDGRAILAARPADVWALAGTDDPIVPRPMSAVAFAALPAGHFEFVDTPGHLLPLTHPDLCARWIERLAR